MNFYSKVSGFVSRVIPSRFGFGRKKEKGEDVGLEEVEVSPGHQSCQSGIPTSDPRYSSIEEDLSTVVQRKGRKEKAKGDDAPLHQVAHPQHPVASTSKATTITETTPQEKSEGKAQESESASSHSTPIDDLLQKALRSNDLDEFADALEYRTDEYHPLESQHHEQGESLPKQQGEQQQEFQEENLEEYIEIPLDDDEESGGEIGSDLERLRDAAILPIPLANNIQHDQIQIDIGDAGIGESVDHGNPTYVESYLDCMYKLGLSPLLPEGSTGGFWGYCQGACLVQLVIYWGITIGSLLDTLASTKLNCIIYMTPEGDLEDFTDMGFFFMNVCLKIYSAYLFTLEQKHFVRMLKSISELRQFTKRYSKETEVKYQTSKVILLAVTSILLSTLSVVFASGLIEWTPQKGLLYYTAKVAIGASIWTVESHMNNATGTNAMYSDYTNNPTNGRLLVGFFGGAIRLCNRAMANATADLILTTGVTLKKEMAHLAKQVRDPENDINPVTMENFEATGGQWEHYQLLQKAVDDTNDTFDCLLKYMHVENITLFVYIIMNIFDGELAFFNVIYFFYCIIKTSCTYRIATKASETNDIFREWIRRLIWKSDDQDFIKKAKIILDRMKEHPLGLGKGQFLIDESFLFRFLGAVGSVFVLQAQSREASTQSNC